ncbi:hypothetical protein [Methanobrevibacter curvatus]|uniref:hypothetical protein n=1 Tax=Methanobrevibacter curvatus TaxID=49547 RepID=UPI00082AF54D|nr:hypothetical protein [Methanobrevibacter curvatus]
MKLRNLIYICIATILIIACVSLIYTNLDNGSDIAENNSKVNNTSSVNIRNINETENNSNNSTNEISPINIRGSNNFEKKNQPKNIPKNSKLTYLQALKIASKFAQKSKFTEDQNVKVYIRYNTYYYLGSSNVLFWDFSVYSKKNNECLAAFLVNDASGLPVMI